MTAMKQLQIHSTNSHAYCHPHHEVYSGELDFGEKEFTGIVMREDFWNCIGRLLQLWMPAALQPTTSEG